MSEREGEKEGKRREGGKKKEEREQSPRHEVYIEIVEGGREEGMR